MHPEYAALAQRIERVWPDSRLEPLSEAELESLAAAFPGAPQHYFQFMRDIGWGSLGENFMFYSGLVPPSDVFDVETARALQGVLLFGDDFAGWSVGFDTRRSWQIVAIDSAAPLVEPRREQTIAEFVNARLNNMERPAGVA